MVMVEDGNVEYGKSQGTVNRKRQSKITANKKK